MTRTTSRKIARLADWHIVWTLSPPTITLTHTPTHSHPLAPLPCQEVCHAKWYSNQSPINKQRQSSSGIVWSVSRTRTQSTFFGLVSLHLDRLKQQAASSSYPSHWAPLFTYACLATGTGRRRLRISRILRLFFLGKREENSKEK